MLAVKLSPDHAPKGQAELRARVSPIREEWQQDGTWTALFDVGDDEIAELYEIAEAVSDGEAQTREIQSEDDIPGFRMSLYLFLE